MGTDQHLRTVLMEYDERRKANLHEEDKRRSEVFKRSDKVANLVADRSQRVFEGMRIALDRPAHAQEITSRLMAEVETLNAQIKAALVEAGMPEDYLQPIYTCEACKDTGYVGEPIREQCNCLRQRLMELSNQSEKHNGLGSHSFAQYDELVYPVTAPPGEKLSQRVYMNRVRKLAEQYAESFPETQKQNLLFTGPSGLGKTFIADCIAQRVMERSFLVRRITSYKLVEIMRKHHYDGSEVQKVHEIQDCDLLFIDDLGAEPMIRNVTIGYLFQIINERNNGSLHTIISTNMSPDEIMEAYTERVASRLLDTDKTRIIRFYGNGKFICAGGFAARVGFDVSVRQKNVLPA